jgi:S-formylglutathione hydrolase FrmB
MKMQNLVMASFLALTFAACTNEDQTVSVSSHSPGLPTERNVFSCKTGIVHRTESAYGAEGHQSIRESAWVVKDPKELERYHKLCEEKYPDFAKK